MVSDQEYEKLRELEEKLWIAEYRFDLEWMNAVLAGDFFEYGRLGCVHSRRDCLNAFPRPIDGSHSSDRF